MESEWIKVSDRLPDELVNEFHLRKLYVNVSRYGTMVGFFMCGKFWINYACEIKNVTHWMPLPKPPIQ